MNKVLFAVNYPYTPNQIDALIIVSNAKVKMPDEIVILPPYPEASLFKEGTAFYRTMDVLQDDLPEGIEAVEVSPESFLAIGTNNPNKPEIKPDDEIDEGMNAQGFLKRPKKAETDFLTEESDDED